MRVNFTEPEIYFGCKRVKGQPDSKQPKVLLADWFVYYHFAYPKGHELYGKRKRFKVKLTLNRYETLAEKIKEAQAIKRVVYENLHSGFNPFARTFVPDQGEDDDGNSFMPMGAALEFALEKKRNQKPPIAHRSMIDAESTIRLFIGAAQQLDMHNIPISQVRRKHVLQILSHLQQKRGFGAVRYNGFKTWLFNCFKILRQWEKIETNIIVDIDSQVEDAPEANEPLTWEEKIIIYKHLEEKHPAFLTAYLCIYHAGMRPKEVLALRVQDYFGTMILVHRESGKTGKKKGNRYAAVPSELAERLDKHIEGAEPDMYIFGRGYKPERREKPRHRNGFTNDWRNWVKEDRKAGGLGIDKDMYGGKHTGADDRYEAGMSVDLIREGLGHSDKAMTKLYMRKLNENAVKKLSQSDQRFTDPPKESEG